MRNFHIFLISRAIISVRNISVLLYGDDEKKLKIIFLKLTKTFFESPSWKKKWGGLKFFLDFLPSKTTK